ncbi:MAG: PQQ-binding-like beta-propeller repeat protein [Pirellulaceae bacterium]
MATDQSNPSAETPAVKPLRIWIPVLLVGGMIFCRFVPGLIENAPGSIWMVAAFGPMLLGLGIILWWLALSRARWSERLIGVIGLIGCIVAAALLLHPSMLGAPVVVMTVPLGLAGFALGGVIASRMAVGTRTGVALMFAFLAASSTALLRNEGVWGDDFAFDVFWRWSTSAEETFLASKSKSTSTTIDASEASSLADSPWPGFRGAMRDGVQRGLQFEKDWNANPPKELWRIALGPAWSSFSVAGNYLFTQEQRGENEAVVCYNADTGKEVWESTIESRFYEALGGVGPRATPTLYGDSLFVMGAAGALQRLSATDGTVLWEADVQEISERSAPPMWGFSSSPLIVDDKAIVHAGGKGDKGILAFDIESGEMVWSSPIGEMSYSSPQVLAIQGNTWVGLLTEKGATFLDASSGDIQFDYEWEHSGYRALQAQVIDGDKLLIPTGLGTGTRLAKLSMSEDGLSAEELWTSLAMKPDFNDVLVFDDHVYGFDNNIFACISLSDGKRQWKGGRYGKGQAMLLEDSGLILVITEKGKLVVLGATPEKHTELFTLDAMDARTWNHPVVVGDRLYIRNAEEAVCYELPTVKDGKANDEGATSDETNSADAKNADTGFVPPTLAAPD